MIFFYTSQYDPAPWVVSRAMQSSRQWFAWKGQCRIPGRWESLGHILSLQFIRGRLGMRVCLVSTPIAGVDLFEIDPQWTSCSSLAQWTKAAEGEIGGSCWGRSRLALMGLSSEMNRGSLTEYLHILRSISALLHIGCS